MQTTKILIIGTSDLVAEQLGNHFRPPEWHPVIVSLGRRAFDAARGEEVDLILLDLNVGDVDGIDLCREFKEREEFKHIPVLLLTGKQKTAEKLNGLELGAVDYINKPFRFSDLEMRIRSILQRRHLQAKLNAASRLGEERSRAELQQIGRAMDSASDAIAILDAQGRVNYLNFAFVELFQANLEDLGRPGLIGELFVKPAAWDLIWKTCSAGNPWSGEVEMVTRQNRRVPTLARADSIPGEAGGFDGAVILFTDISNRKRLERDLIYLANHDPLTSLYNRRHFDELLEEAVIEAGRGRPIYLFYIDLDNFKVVNDSAGHAAGDRLLLEITELLRNQTREGDQIARFGGDEFTILLFDVHRGEAQKAARELLALLDEFRFKVQGRSYSTSASIGIAAVTGEDTADEVMAQADAACNQVKAKGRNGLEVYRPHNEEIRLLNQEASWSILIKDALRDQRFELWLQPIRPLRGRSEPYFEVLLRMRDPDGNIVLPGAFLPAAERFGSMEQLDKYVIARAIGLLKERSRLRLSINISAKTLNDPDLPAWLEGRLRDSHVFPPRASFEITETAMIQNLVQARELILKIKELGCQFALDDFGCGASSLSYLRELPVDLLKIDGSFIHGLAHDRVNRALVKSINDAAHILGKKTVAEYVINAETLRQVERLGIDYAQGMHICEPAPPSKFFSLYRGVRA